tara:strand:+ start:15 stop:671 length:657 start_codon:yes stop_codon:yes gene_type:complete
MRLITKFIFLSILIPIYSNSTELDVNQNSLKMNVGYMSEYWARGSFQAASVFYTDINYTSGPIVLSGRLADLSDRSGGDLFLALNGNYNFTLSSIPVYVGVGAYRYKNGLDYHYNEISVGADFNLFSVDTVVLGDYNTNPSTDYWHFQITVPLGLVDYKYGSYSGVWQYTFHEISYKKNFNNIYIGFNLGVNNDNAMGDAKNSNQDTEYGILSIGYTF